MRLKITDEQMNDTKSRWLAAVRQKGLALRAAPEEMKGDRELCTAAVAEDGRTLEFASQEMKGDRELCMAAVAQNGQALQHCSKETKGDETIVTTALQNAHGDVIGIFLKASANMKNNERIVLVAMQATTYKRGIWDILSTDMQAKTSVRKAAGM